jgi:hypothetical protein
MPKNDAKKLAEELVRSMKHHADFDLHWEGDRMLFAAPRGLAKGTHGTIGVTDHEIHVQIDLPLHLRVVKATMESKLTEKLTRFTAHPSA